MLDTWGIYCYSERYVNIVGPSSGGPFKSYVHREEEWRGEGKSRRGLLQPTASTQQVPTTGGSNDLLKTNSLEEKQNRKSKPLL